MAQIKTKINQRSVEEFLNGIPEESRRQECFALSELMQEITGAEPKMWGDSIVGYGTYHYKYESGREGDWFLTGFSPRKQAVTVYALTGYEFQPELMKRLGKHKTGRSCIYIKRLSEINLSILKDILQKSVGAVLKSR